jgi:hypothetical protein
LSIVPYPALVSTKRLGSALETPISEMARSSAVRPESSQAGRSAAQPAGVTTIKKSTEKTTINFMFRIINLLFVV